MPSSPARGVQTRHFKLKRMEGGTYRDRKPDVTLCKPEQRFSLQIVKRETRRNGLFRLQKPSRGMKNLDKRKTWF